jgi:glycogen operon protein
MGAPIVETDMDRWGAQEGTQSPLGVTWVEAEQAYNFALYSKHATGVTLLLYAADDVVMPASQYHFNYLINKSGRIWHCRIPASQLRDTAYYAYRVEGPFEPGEGQRFDPEKILLDPYAKGVLLPQGFDREAARESGSNAGRAPLGLIPTQQRLLKWREDCPPRHTHDMVIYEMHVKGLTMRANSGVSPNKRGTFAGVIERIPYLKELGVTAVELLPVYQRDPHKENYWGYMPLNFFSPHHEYASDPVAGEQVHEFRAMVKALHDAGIEVLLDVVYNHTTEGNQNGPTYSYRGIDNTTYYLLEEDRRWYRNDTGTGNVVHTSNRYVRRTIVESLLYWTEEMHVDGFRFDLASLFTRNTDGSINLDDPPIIAEISGLAELKRIRLIAEAYLAARYNRPGFDVMHHFTYRLVSDGDLMEGVAAEAASLAGHLKLGKLIYLYDDNHISLAASTQLSFTEDRAQRFAAYGWHTQSIDDGNDVDAIDRAIRTAQQETERPSLILGFASMRWERS